MENKLYSKIFGSLIGLAIGDAMGGPVEGRSYQDIERDFKEVTTFLPYTCKTSYHGPFTLHPGSYTDDARMMKLLCEACDIAQGPPQKGDIAQVLLQRYYQSHTVLEKGFLEEYCFKALYTEDKEVFGGQPTNGGIMGIAPMGLIFACDPEAAFAHTFRNLYFVTGYARTATAMAAAMVAAACIVGHSLDDVVQDAILASQTYRGHQEGALWKDWHMYSHVALKSEHLVEQAWQLGKKHGNHMSIRAELYELVVQDFFADAAESLAIAVAMLAAANGDPMQTIIGAIGFGRDNDSSAAVAGSISGALHGFEAISTTLIAQCEASNPEPSCESYARRMHSIVEKRIKNHQKISTSMGMLL
jgi:ADP-ribosylglycohydrolase